MATVGYMQDLADRLYGVLTQVRALGHEDNPKGAIAEFLREFPDVRETDVEVEGGYTDGGGSFRETDIMARGVAFEVKKDAGDLGTDKVNDAGTQIGRRLEACAAEEYGWATNGEKWIRYVLHAGGEGGIKADKIFDIEQREGNLITPEIRNLVSTLESDLKPRPAPNRKTVVTIFIPAQHALNRLSLQARNYDSYKIKFDLWQEQLLGAHMNIPKGEGAHELFARHTLLIAAARLIVGELSGTAPDEIDERIKKNGGFVGWLVWEGEEEELKKAGKEVCSAIYQAVVHYDWRKSGEDVLKHLYHDFIEKKIRHDFGEYYTPDWLANKIVEKVLNEDWCKAGLKAAYKNRDLSGFKVLDPSCGSGTFLYAAAKRLLSFAEEIIDGELAQTNAVLSLVYGFDIHPVAVELSHATLSSVFKTQPIRPLNVYLGDALQMQTQVERGTIFDGNELVLKHKFFNNVKISFPKEIVYHEHFGKIIDATISVSAMPNQINLLIDGYGIKNPVERNALRVAAKELKKIRDEGKDGIWAWFVKNLAEPYRLSEEKVGRLVGNPPWITHNDWEGSRQEELEELSRGMKVWLGGKLAPNNDLAALFVARVIQLYLVGKKEEHGGHFGFVLPGAALRAQVWKNFREAAWGGTDMSELRPWQIETNPPPFPDGGQSACVVFGKQGNTRPLPKPQIMSGDWDSQVLSDKETYENQPSQFWSKSSKENSIRRGASLFPHVLVRVRKKDLRQAGEKIVSIKTCQAQQEPWKFVKQIEAEIEEWAVHPAMWSDALLPFRILEKDYLICRLESAQYNKKTDSSLRITEHWSRVESLWQKHKKERSPETLEDRIDYYKGLSSQLEILGNRVIYNKSGSYIAAAILIEDNKIIIDDTFYRVATRTISESYYLATILNSDALSDALLESRNTDRHFDTLPFQKIPIKRFDKNNEHHLVLATLGKKAEQEAAAEAINEEQTTKSREQIRNALRASKTMQKINEAVKAILPNYCD